MLRLKKERKPGNIKARGFYQAKQCDVKITGQLLLADSWPPSSRGVSLTKSVHLLEKGPGGS
jgi:hypothetical protein